MAQLPLIQGVYGDAGNSDLRTAYPRNYMPIPKDNGMTKGSLRPAPGLATFASGGPGKDRGGIDWNGVAYRVMGTSLVTVSSAGVISASLGTIGGSLPVTFMVSFTRLAIIAAYNLYYWDGTTFTQVTDVDLGTNVLHGIYIDGYFAVTDGTAIIVTELNNPTSIDPLKYGSSEADPDSIKGLAKLRNEMHAVNRYTIEGFQNIGGSVFPFSRIPGSIMTRGAIGTKAFCVVDDTIYFVGSRRDEPPAIWAGANGALQKISTGEIDKVLRLFTEDQLSLMEVETMIDDAQRLVMFHLPDRTAVFDMAATAVADEPVWFWLTSGIGINQYRARRFSWSYNRWIFGDMATSGVLGTTDKTRSDHFTATIDWEFNTVILYSEGVGAQMFDMELTGMFGSVAIGANPVILTSYSKDGVTFSTERPVRAGSQGNRTLRVGWMNAGSIENFRIQKFRGFSDSHATLIRLGARFEALSV